MALYVPALSDRASSNVIIICLVRKLSLGYEVEDMPIPLIRDRIECGSASVSPPRIGPRDARYYNQAHSIWASFEKFNVVQIETSLE
ncbi:hypothetical protein POX_a00507 [Penicillium oxalicum]|uniref:Uncharacterized protein n=1 Tax=Penicillium oxalicum (strain 114-2 / CGMCC 5302) TaxID=933388 RepID=S7ZVR3_PENO1|nr:hypothetical protein POX_a00507 [Penicillium oxalicum]EPS34519.1 hypothetical protein PDE_09483 [Penicillium oxalicum 114-2]KAI2793919.1 hypothetical protein POX_a00507 [Penicillium oxalicum]